ncbi:hypothetical protein HF675_03505 [Serratia sp. JUb9]|uniref:hypothetical protein n=1 Tax=Serratia sp. JUb9 TaxID=2724469 RepID=UPI00164CEDEF|nr:hypothetical protein [Serratia sp. JUb9]QNK33146.1 hypothetical protein HF675_03505 [Serratia sp. JUb9]
MSKLTGRALLAALMMATGGTVLVSPAGGSDGGTTLNLKARIVESTCAFSFGGANGATLDFGEWSYVSIGTPAAPKYMLTPVRGNGEVSTNTTFNVSVTADPNCPKEGKMVVMVGGFDVTPGTAGFAGAKVREGAPSAVLTAPRLNADGSEAATPYYFPYDVGFYMSQDSGDCTIAWYEMFSHDGTYLTHDGKYLHCTAEPTGWGREQKKSSNAQSDGRVFVTSGTRPNSYIRADGVMGVGTPDKSATTQLMMFFAGPIEITTLWGANPPPPGTIFSGQLTLTATYL